MKSDIRFQLMQSAGKVHPLFMVHGDSANYLLPGHLGEEIPFYAFFHQGADGYPFRYDTITDIAARYLMEVRRIQPHGPYRLAGYSIGGVIAYEMAQKIKSAGDEVEYLFLIDTRCPAYREKKDYHNRQFSWKESRFRRLIRKVYKRAVCNLFLMFHWAIPLRHRSFFIMETYRIARSHYELKPYEGDLILYRSRSENFSDLYLGWKPYIKGNVTVREFEGNHHTLIKEPNIHWLAEDMQALLLGRR